MQQIGRVVQRSCADGSPATLTVLTSTGIITCAAGDIADDVDVGDLVGGPPWKRLARPSGNAAMVTGDSVRWLLPQACGKSRLTLLKQRQKMALAIRQWFFDQDFLEVPAPVLVCGTCPDMAIDSIDVGNRYLTTSTEYQLKRMMVGGCPRIVSFGPNFRKGEISPVHNPEFTMIEWARVGEPIEKIEEDAREILLTAARTLGSDSAVVQMGNHIIDLAGPWQRLTVRDAWSRYLGVDVSEKFDHEEINQAVMKSPTLLVPESFVAELGDLVSYLVDAIQPHLGQTCPTVLTDWPQIMTSSTVQSSENNTIAVRSEIFVGGIELADGFPFLIEPQKQRQGFEGQQQRRNLSGKPIVHIDEQYLLALEHGLPDGAGMAMGFDRLVMLLLGQGNIRQVLPFAWDEL